MKDPVTKVSFAEHPYLDQSKLPDNIDSIPYRSVETLKEANQLHKMVEYFHDIASKDRFSPHHLHGQVRAPRTKSRKP